MIDSTTRLFCPSIGEVTQLRASKIAKRRTLRLLQVRQISMVNSVATRNRYQQLQRLRLRKEAKKIKKEVDHHNLVELQNKQTELDVVVESLGSAHLVATNSEDPLIQERINKANQRKAARARFELAFEHLRSERARVVEEEETRRHFRESALATERERAARIASLSPPRPDPLAPHLCSKNSSTPCSLCFNQRDGDIRVERAIPCTTGNTNAATAAALAEEVRLEVIEQKAVSAAVEAAIKADIRGKQALKRARVMQYYESLMQNLDEVAMERTTVNHNASGYSVDTTASRSLAFPNESQNAIRIDFGEPVHHPVDASQEYNTMMDRFGTCSANSGQMIGRLESVRTQIISLPTLRTNLRASPSSPMPGQRAGSIDHLSRSPPHLPQASPTPTYQKVSPRLCQETSRALSTEQQPPAVHPISVSNNFISGLATTSRVSAVSMVPQHKIAETTAAATALPKPSAPQSQEFGRLSRVLYMSSVSPRSRIRAVGNESTGYCRQPPNDTMMERPWIDSMGGVTSSLSLSASEDPNTGLHSRSASPDLSTEMTGALKQNRQYRVSSFEREKAILDQEVAKIDKQISDLRQSILKKTKEKPTPLRTILAANPQIELDPPPNENLFERDRQIAPSDELGVKLSEIDEDESFDIILDGVGTTVKHSSSSRNESSSWCAASPPRVVVTPPPTNNPFPVSPSSDDVRDNSAAIAAPEEAFGILKETTKPLRASKDTIDLLRRLRLHIKQHAREAISEVKTVACATEPELEDKPNDHPHGSGETRTFEERACSPLPAHETAPNSNQIRNFKFSGMRDVDEATKPKMRNAAIDTATDQASGGVSTMTSQPRITEELRQRAIELVNRQSERIRNLQRSTWKKPTYDYSRSGSIDSVGQLKGSSVRGTPIQARVSGGNAVIMQSAQPFPFRTSRTYRMTSVPPPPPVQFRAIASPTSSSSPPPPFPAPLALPPATQSTAFQHGRTSPPLSSAFSKGRSALESYSLPVRSPVCFSATSPLPSPTPPSMRALLSPTGRSTPPPPLSSFSVSSRGGPFLQNLSRVFRLPLETRQIYQPMESVEQIQDPSLDDPRSSHPRKVKASVVKMSDLATKYSLTPRYARFGSFSGLLHSVSSVPVRDDSHLVGLPTSPRPCGSVTSAQRVLPSSATTIIKAASTSSPDGLQQPNLSSVPASPEWCGPFHRKPLVTCPNMPEDGLSLLSSVPIVITESRASGATYKCGSLLENDPVSPTGELSRNPSPTIEVNNKKLMQPRIARQTSSQARPRSLLFYEENQSSSSAIVPPGMHNNEGSYEQCNENLKAIVKSVSSPDILSDITNRKRLLLQSYVKESAVLWGRAAATNVNQGDFDSVSISTSEVHGVASISSVSTPRNRIPLAGQSNNNQHPAHSPSSVSSSTRADPHICGAAQTTLEGESAGPVNTPDRSLTVNVDQLCSSGHKLSTPSMDPFKTADRNPSLLTESSPTSETSYSLTSALTALSISSLQYIQSNSPNKFNQHPISLTTEPAEWTSPLPTSYSALESSMSSAVFDEQAIWFQPLKYLTCPLLPTVAETSEAKGAQVSLPSISSLTESTPNSSSRPSNQFTILSTDSPCTTNSPSTAPNASPMKTRCLTGYGISSDDTNTTTLHILRRSIPDGDDSEKCTPASGLTTIEGLLQNIQSTPDLTLDIQNGLLTSRPLWASFPTPEQDKVGSSGDMSSLSSDMSSLLITKNNSCLINDRENSPAARKDSVPRPRYRTSKPKAGSCMLRKTASLVDHPGSGNGSANILYCPTPKNFSSAGDAHINTTTPTTASTLSCLRSSDVPPTPKSMTFPRSVSSARHFVTAPVGAAVASSLVTTLPHHHRRRLQELDTAGLGDDRSVKDDFKSDNDQEPTFYSLTTYYTIGDNHFDANPRKSKPVKLCDRSVSELNDKTLLEVDDLELVDEIRLPREPLLASSSSSSSFTATSRNTLSSFLKHEAECCWAIVPDSEKAVNADDTLSTVARGSHEPLYPTSTLRPVHNTVTGDPKNVHDNKHGKRTNPHQVVASISEAENVELFYQSANQQRTSSQRPADHLRFSSPANVSRLFDEGDLAPAAALTVMPFTVVTRTQELTPGHVELASDTISQRQMVPPEQTIVPIRSQPVCTKNDVLLPELDQLSVQANHPRYLQLAPTVNIAVDNNYPKGLPPAPELKACSQDNISVASTNKDATGSSKSRLEPTAAIIAKLTASTVASRARQRKILDELQRKSLDGRRTPLITLSRCSRRKNMESPPIIRPVPEDAQVPPLDLLKVPQNALVNNRRYHGNKPNTPTGTVNEASCDPSTRTADCLIRVEVSQPEHKITECITDILEANPSVCAKTKRRAQAMKKIPTFQQRRVISNMSQRRAQLDVVKLSTEFPFDRVATGKVPKSPRDVRESNGKPNRTRSRVTLAHSRNFLRPADGSLVTHPPPWIR